MVLLSEADRFRSVPLWKAMVHRLQTALESSGGRVKTQIAGPHQAEFLIQ